MKDRQKVLIVHNYYNVSGGEDTVVANEINLLKENGHEVILYTRHNSEIKTNGLLAKLSLPFTALFSLKTYKEIKRIIESQNIDILHVHNTLPLISPSVYYAAFRCHIPVVQTVHNFRLICPNALLYREGHICEDCIQKGLTCAIKHKCYRDSFSQTIMSVAILVFHRLLGTYGKINYICLTEFNMKKLLTLKQIKQERVFIKPNYTTSTVQVIPYEQRKDQFVYVGRLDKTKGIDILLRSWRLLGEEAPKLILCGTGPMEQWCRDYAQEMKFDTVEIKGMVSHETVSVIVAESKALIMSTQLYEGMPMSIIEAFAVGTPVIGSDIGNVRMLIEENCTGFLFDRESEEELASAVMKMRAMDFVENCRRVYEMKYNKEHNYEFLSQIYHKVLEEAK